MLWRLREDVLGLSHRVVLGAILLVLVADVLYLCPKNEIKYLCDCDV